MKLVRMNKSNGTWQRLESQWREQCTKYNEDFDVYAEASLGTLRDECDDGNPDGDTGVFSLLDQNGENHAVCFLNRAAIPGWAGVVLRVRHLVLSPYYDFEALEIED